MLRRSLRRRIAATIATVCVVILAVVGVMFYETSENMEAVLVDQLVFEELNFLVQHHKTHPDYTPVVGPIIQYYVITPDTDIKTIPSFVQGLGPGHHEIDIGNGDGDRDVAIRDEDGIRYVVVYNIGPYEEREREFRQLILLSLVGIAILAIGLGYALAGLLTRQLTQLAVQLKTVVPNQPHEPFRTAEQDREVLVLAEAMDAYQQRIVAILEREREFTANVSHELRTPLTMIRTSCELLVNDQGMSVKSRARVDYIFQAADQMREQLEGLLFLAREGELADIGELELEPLLQDIVRPLQAEIDRKALDLQIAIVPSASLEASRSALYLVLDNLIRNAVRYTDQGHIRIAYENNAITVSDSGVGMSEDEIARVFERTYRASDSQDGLGIGLDIVRRICERLGWAVEVSSTPSTGTTFRVVLQARGS